MKNERVDVVEEEGSSWKCEAVVFPKDRFE
jgi:hypothetical protein